MRQFALELAMVVAVAGPAGANGRPPATSTVHFQQGNEQNIAAGMTFGLLLSHDGGATWHWTCEKNIGYAGMYDPIYAYSQSGAIFATTFDGLKVNRDGCNFLATPPGTTFVSQDVLGPDHALYITAADPNDAKIYKSTNDGMTFPQSASPGLANDWWQTIIIAPSDANRVYLSGYRFVMACDQNSPIPLKTCTVATDCQDATHQMGMCEGQKKWLLFKSIDSGQTFSPLPGNLLFPQMSSTVGLTTSENSAINFVGVDHTNPNIIYAQVSLEHGVIGDGIYKIDTSTGTTWTHLFSSDVCSIQQPAPSECSTTCNPNGMQTCPNPMQFSCGYDSKCHQGDVAAFVARASGDIVVGTPTLGSFKSTNGGTSWTALAGSPHINCLTENSAGEVWACTQNYDTKIGTVTIPGDGYGIMKSTDLAAWTGVLHYQDIQGPISCASDSVQQTQCVQNAMTGQVSTGLWCGLVAQLGITNSPINCSPVDGGPDVTVKPGKKGCCDAGSGAGAPALLSVVVACGLLLRRRRPEV